MGQRRTLPVYLFATKETIEGKLLETYTTEQQACVGLLKMMHSRTKSNAICRIVSRVQMESKPFEAVRHDSQQGGGDRDLKAHRPDFCGRHVPVTCL